MVKYNLNLCSYLPAFNDKNFLKAAKKKQQLIPTIDMISEAEFRGKSLHISYSHVEPRVANLDFNIFL